MTDKVIEFPKNKVVRDLPEEVHKARQAKADQKFADSVVDELSGIVITELDNYGVEVTNKVFAKDFILVVDALRASVYRQFELEHHLHDFIDENVKIIEGKDGLSKEELADKISSIIEDMIKEQVDSEEKE
jgi:predicted AlkP superfamily pyrophosphatase or phosphodiesterase